MSTPPTDENLLDRVRKLLAKAEAEGVTPHEAEALTGKAAELMARYGIDRARLSAARPETDAPADKIVTLDNPWATVKGHLLSGLAQALRCQCVLLNGRSPGTRLHVFGYASDIERKRAQGSAPSQVARKPRFQLARSGTAAAAAGCDRPRCCPWPSNLSPRRRALLEVGRVALLRRAGGTRPFGPWGPRKRAAGLPAPAAAE